MKLYVSALIFLAHVSAVAGLPGADMTTTIVRCNEVQWDKSLQVEITAGGLAGLTMARVSELVDGAVQFRKTFIIQNQGTMKKNPPIHFYEGQGIRLEIEETEGDVSFPAAMEVELDGELRKAGMLCRF